MIASLAMERAYDIVLFGASGFTGRLVAEYLSLHARGIRWAIAGRSRAKLDTVARDLELGSNVGIVLCDVERPAELETMAKMTRVVCTTVGPYAKYGKDLATACAEHGTHYCDLTGEVPFIRWSIDVNHVRARETGARIVHCAGFDSIPSDLGVLVLADHAGEPLTQVDYVLESARGGISGGTIASLLDVLAEAAGDPSLRRMLADPYALSPDRPNDLGLDPNEGFGIAWNDELGCYVGPFLMAPINTRVVRRSNALSNFRYGRHFRYSESMRIPGGRAGLPLAVAFSAGYASMAAALVVPVSRRFIVRYLPSPGEGPSKATRDTGNFAVRIVGRTESGRRVEARVQGTNDPGYGETAKMLGETALALSHESFASTEGGVLTPAAALGMALVERLRGAGMTFAANDRR